MDTHTSKLCHQQTVIKVGRLSSTTKRKPYSFLKRRSVVFYGIEDNEKSVSRNHLEIHIDDGNLSIHDCSSRGTVLQQDQSLLSCWSGKWGNHTIYAGLVKGGETLQSTKVQLCIKFELKQHGILVNISKVSLDDVPQINDERPAKKRKTDDCSKWTERAVSGTVGALVGSGLTIYGLAQIGASLKN